MPPSRNTNKSVNSVVRAGQVLTCLSLGINRVSKISKNLRLSTSTTHRLLKTLESIGFAIKDPSNNSYYLGSSIFRLSRNLTTSHQFLISIALESMEQLRELSGETVSLTVRQGLQRVQIEELPSKKELKVAVGAVFSVPMYAGSASKVLLSELDEKEINGILNKIELTGVGPNTITEKATLLKEVEKVKKQGFSTSHGEVISGAASISIPIKHYFCPVALSVIGPEERFSPNMMAVLKELKKCGLQIADKLKRHIS
jgi:IclR family KDG regulon transcriptional repressor